MIEEYSLVTERVAVDSKDKIDFSIEEIEQTIGSRFLKIADKYPDKVAIETESISISYKELALTSRQFAAAIQQRISAENFSVVIALQNPQDFISAILGTLMSGGIYVPIEIDFPSERVNYVIENSEAKLIVMERSSQTLFGLLPEACRNNVLFFDEIFATEPLACARIHQNPLSPASILYTSGSTGKPKGVLQIHRNILYHIHALTALFRINPADKHSLLSSFIFDGSTTDLYCALLNGATVVPIDVRKTGAKGLSEILQNHGITLYHSTPTIFRECIHQSKIKNFDSVRLIILGGEVVTGNDYKLFYTHFSSACLFVNGYGATETSGFVALNIMTKAELEIADSAILPIGKELAHIELLLHPDTDEGELWVRSKYISMGYWKDEALTNAVFDFTGAPEATRIFKTGDRAQRLSDGKIKLLSRSDRQVKIRGYRINLNEIEAVAAKNSDIAHVVAKTFFDKRTNTEELVLYVNLKPGINSTETLIRNQLALHLPRYMIPILIEIREEFPRTPTGKIDTKALTVEDKQQTVIPGSFQNATHLKDRLAKIWSQILQIEKPGVDDNFFDLGGSSLLMAKVHLMLTEHLALTLPLFKLFEYPTLRSLSEYIENKTVVDFNEIYLRMKKRNQGI